jgi:hypothetical protein
MFKCETELLRIEGDSATDISNVVPDAVKAPDEIVRHDFVYIMMPIQKR